MTGVKAYMTGKIKVKGDLLLAQRLEGVFEALGGREVRKRSSIICMNHRLITFL
jgi:putative sterol carrier protein